jgi:carbonic anhydrase/acetyltransferase-like protein (isoleucine patch superfamily)
MAIYQLDDIRPDIDPTAWVAPGAHVMGAVKLHANSSIWFGAVIRGDNEPVVVGEGSNIQDGSMLHSDYGMPLTVGKNVTVGHKVTLHGCTIGDNTLIGMDAVVLNGAVIGKNCVVAAGSLVTEGKAFPDGSMIMGSPAKAVRELDEAFVARIEKSAQGYMANAQRFAKGLKRID